MKGRLMNCSDVSARKISRLLLLLSFGLHLFLVNAHGGGPSIQSPDGRARIEFSANGRVVLLTRAVQAAQQTGIPLGPGDCGLFVNDPVAHTTYRIGSGVPARFENSSGGLKETATISAAKLAVEATYHFLPDGALAVDGVMTDLTQTDRVADIGFTLPLQAIAGAWQANVATETPIAADMKPASQTDFSLAAVVGPKNQYAVAYSIPPDRPQRFEMTYSPAGGFTILVKFGLSPDAKGPLHSRAPFSFTIDVVNGNWGLRSALQRYYSRSPEWFDDRVHHYGFWTSGIPTDFSTFDASVYAFHGSGSHSIHVQTLDEYTMNEAWRFDAAHGIFNLAYIIPGQLEITHLKSLPANYDQAMADLKTWTHAPSFFSGHNFPNSYPDPVAHKQRILNSGLFDPDGHYVVRIRNTKWGGDSVTFPVNPNPKLYADADKETTARYLLGYVRKMMTSPYMNGSITDSLGGFSAYYNYRHEHFAYEQVPLTYQDGVLKPAIFNGISETEFLWGLRDLLHANGKFVAANDTQYKVSPPNPLKPLPFMTYALDIVTSEGASRMASVENPMLYRMMSYRKPLMFHIHDTDWKRLSSAQDIELVKNSILGDFFLSGGPTTSPGSSDEFYEVPAQEIEYQRKYTPVLRLLAKAGWEPVTGVKTGDAAVLAERYGGQKDFYLVLYNTGGVKKHLAISIDPTAVDWPASSRVEEILSSADFQTRAKAMRETGRLTLSAGEELVLHIRP